MTLISTEAFDTLAVGLQRLITRVDSGELLFDQHDDVAELSIPAFRAKLRFDRSGMYHMTDYSRTFHSWNVLLENPMSRPSMEVLLLGSQNVGMRMKTTTLSFFDFGSMWRDIELPCCVVAHLWDFANYVLPKSPTL